MERKSKMVINLTSKARLHILCNLVFFYTFFSCSPKTDHDSLRIDVKDNKAVSVSLPDRYAEIINDQSKLFITLKSESEDLTPILGSFHTSDSLYFKPLVPFTPGKSYQLYYGNELLEEFQISILSSSKVEILDFYPTFDTVPENLLKMYITFSEPMGVSYSSEFIRVYNEQGDSIKSLFLSLNPELWNEDCTVLTLWLDPGRVKRGLIPNQMYGAPLEKGKNYLIKVKSGWKSQNGTRITEEFEKRISVTDRDSISPSIENWIVDPPPANTKLPLLIDFRESLDYTLISKTIQIYFENTLVDCTVDIGEHETDASFSPREVWRPGSYEVLVESRLEDLAGNNINKLFEVDTKRKVNPDTANIRKLRFRITQ